VGRDCLVAHADQAPYLRYFNHEMKREALVPITSSSDNSSAMSWAAGRPGRPWLFPRPSNNIDRRLAAVGHR